MGNFNLFWNNFDEIKSVEPMSRGGIAIGHGLLWSMQKRKIWKKGIIEQDGTEGVRTQDKNANQTQLLWFMEEQERKLYRTDHIVMQKSINFSIVTLHYVLIINLNLVNLSYLKIQLLSQNQKVKKTILQNKTFIIWINNFK